MPSQTSRLAISFWALLLVIFAIWNGNAQAHRLKGSDASADALLVWRGAEDFSAGVLRGMRLDPDGSLAWSDSLPPREYGNSATPLPYHVYMSPEVKLPFPATEFLPSWNVEFDTAQMGFAVDLRFRWAADPSEPGASNSQPTTHNPQLACSSPSTWSAWYDLGTDGTDDPTSPPLMMKDSFVLVDDDYVIANQPAVAIQWRIRFWKGSAFGDTTTSASTATTATPSSRAEEFVRWASRPRLRHFALAAANPVMPPAEVMPNAKRVEMRRQLLADLPAAPSKVNSGALTLDLARVPWRTQVIGPPLEDYICCPTSVSIVKEYFGDSCPTTDVAARAFDRRAGIYGCWPRAAQVLSESGLDTWVERFRSLDEAEPYFRLGLPIIVSLQIRKGDLEEAPNYDTGGHIIVLRGIDADGRILVSDPGRSKRENGFRAYKREGIQRVWINRGGVGIIGAPHEWHLPRPYCFLEGGK